MDNKEKLIKELTDLENEYAEAFKNDVKFEDLRAIFVRIKEIQKFLSIPPNKITIKK